MFTVYNKIKMYVKMIYNIYYLYILRVQVRQWVPTGVWQQSRQQEWIGVGSPLGLMLWQLGRGHHVQAVAAAIGGQEVAQAAARGHQRRVVVAHQGGGAWNENNVGLPVDTMFWDEW